MVHADLDVFVEGLEHSSCETFRASGRAHDLEWATRMHRLLDPARHRDVGEVDDMVAVDVGEEHRRQLVGCDSCFCEADDRSATSVELQRDVTTAHEHSGTRATG